MAQSRILHSPFPATHVQRSSFYGLLQNVLEKYPNKLALIDAETDQRLTYRELGVIVERVAYNLSLLGVQKNEVFGISSIHSIQYVVLLLACMRLGAIPSLISNLCTKDELCHCIRLASVKYLFMDGPRAQVGVDAGRQVALKHIFTDGEHKECIPFCKLEDNKSGHQLEMLPDDKLWDEAALYLFSSGTTGPPKAVAIPHRAIVPTVSHLLQFLSVAQGTSILYQPLAHLYGVGMLLSILFNGYLCILMPKFTLEKYSALILEWKVTHLQLVPPILVMLSKSPQVTKGHLASVRSLMVGAAPTTPELETVAKQKLNKDVCFINVYGMSEALIITIVPGPQHNIPGTVPAGSTGVVAPDCKVKVCDVNTGEPLGPGQKGEIVIHTPYAMTGYLNNPEQTAAVIDKDGWLHTGDVGLYDENGYFFIVDRIKELIKVKGFQVSPSELEGLLLEHPLVEDVGVTSVPSDMEGELPKAWVVRRDQSLTEKMVQDYVAERTAPYKHLKGGVLFVKEIPKSPNGKILRRVMKEKAWPQSRI